MANKEAELKKQQVERDGGRAEGREGSRRTRAGRSETCVRARDQIRQLAATQDVLVRINEKGERVVVDPEARQRERENLEKWVGQNCRP